MLPTTRFFQHFQLLLFASVVASFAHSDMLGRDAGVTRFNVTPTNQHNATAIAATEALLRKQYGDAAVQTTSNENSLPTWLITSNDDETKASLKLTDGVQGVTTDSNATLTKREAGGGPRQSDLAAAPATKWSILAKDGSDIKKTEAFLKTQIERGTSFFEVGIEGSRGCWGNVTLSKAAKDTVAKYEGVADIVAEGVYEALRALPVVDMDQDRSLRIRSGNLSSLDITWQKQSPADKSLFMDSQYNGADFAGLNSFVHVSNPGQNTWVYVIDLGVQIFVKNPDDHSEFKTENGRVLQTTYLNDLHVPPEDDGDSRSHGTAAASKAVGRKYGLAKEATLVSVKHAPHQMQFAAAFRLVADDLRNNPDRQSRSVVTTSGEVYVAGLTYQQAKSTLLYQTMFLDPLQEIMKMGVPVTVAAGNNADIRPLVNNAIPILFQDDDTPLIIVGGTGYDGKRWPRSQKGPVSTIFASGVDVDCQTKVDKAHDLKTGTSFAAPQVAGLIATYMSYDTMPWDNSKTGIDRVKTIRDYVFSEASSWVRPNRGERCIWNGAKKENHDSAVAGPYGNALESAVLGIALAALPRGKALNIVWEAYFDPHNSKNNKFRLLFFETTKDESAECQPTSKAVWSGGRKDNDGGDKDLKWLGGTYTLNNLDGVNCEYKNDGNSAGALWCEDRHDTTTPRDKKQKTIMISCRSDEARVDGRKPCLMPDNLTHRTTQVYCEW